MARFDLHPVRNLQAPDGRRIAVVSVDGSVDASTVVAFQERVEGLLADGINVAILDCGALGYINSTGMGRLINLRDKYEANGGSIELCNVPDKVKTLFGMLGIGSIYEIHADADAALKAVGAFDQPKKDETGTRKRGDTARLKKAKKKGVQFPVRIACASCGSRLRIPQPGYYRCPKCGIHYSVSEEARVKAYNTVKPKVVELRLPAEPEFCESVRNAARSVAEVARLDREALDQLEAAVDEATNLVISRCSAGGRVRFIQVYMVGDEREFICGFKTSEHLFEADLDAESDEETKFTLELIRNTVSSVEIIDLEPQGQILKLVKAGSSARASA